MSSHDDLKGKSAFRVMIELIQEDYRVHQSDWTLPGFRAIAVHRFGNWVPTLRIRLIRGPLSLLYRVLYRHVRNCYGIELPRTVKVGRRLFIAHQSGIVVHWLAEIGDDCLIRQNVTIGAASISTVHQAPVLKNRVQLGCGAAVLGGIVVGDDVRIGPNAVVTTDIPAGHSVVVAPNIIRKRVSRIPDSTDIQMNNR